MLTTIATAALLGGLVAPDPSSSTRNAGALEGDTGRRYSLFGLDVCIGGPSDAKRCDLQLPAPPPKTATKPPERMPGVLTLFGKTLCLGDAPAHVACDFRWHEPAGKSHGA